MLPPIALVLWIIIGTVLFACTKPTRAMMLVYVIGILILPQDSGTNGVITFTSSLRIDKYTACNLAALLGTLIFAPQRLRNYRFNWIDAAMLALFGVQFVSSVSNNAGAQDGVSQIITFLRLWYPIIFMAKVHLTTLPDLMIALRTIIGGAVCYAFVGFGEFRLSPQLHKMVYGYFQHSFDQFMRWGFFRPIGMLEHAIEFAGFMSTSAIAAYWLTIRRQFPPLWGWLSGWWVVGILTLGVLCTMTFAAYGAFLGGIIILTLLQWTHRRALLLILPLLALTYMAGRYLDILDPAFLVRGAQSVNADRADSLIYRVESEKINLERIRHAPWVGQSPEGALSGYGDKVSVQRAIDAYWLIILAFWGLAGWTLWIAVVWSSVIGVIWWHWPKMPEEVRTVAGVIAVMLGLQLIDFLFNAFPSRFLLLLDIGMITTAAFAMHRSRRAATTARRTHMATQLEGVV